MGLRAMFSAITGLQSHSTWLDVIGNNISNVNTTAFKSSRVTFSDAISQTTYSGSGPSTASNLGGVNPQQVGLGSRVSSIQTLFNPGPVLQTGNATDIAIKGNGFLVVQQGNSTMYSRAGNLTFDGQGNLVDANGGLIQGFQAQLEYTQTTFNSQRTDLTPAPALGVGPAVVTRAEMILDTTNTSQIGNIQIKKGMTLPPRATSVMDFRGNLDSFLQASDATRGGVYTLGVVGGAQYLPMGSADEAGIAYLDANKALGEDPGNLGFFALRQISDYAGMPMAANGLPSPVIQAGIDLTYIRNNQANFVWETGAIPPAHVMTQTVYDSLGNPREITINLYQVNDLGDVYNANAGLYGNNPNGPSQVAYAWYAFETTGGVAPDTDNLLGGTAIIEGDYGTGMPNFMGFDRGIAVGANRAQYVGDLLYFNTDGSLATQGAAWVGGTGGLAGASLQTEAHLYLPARNYPLAPGNPPVSPLPVIGAEQMDITLDFGFAGVLTQGQRNGLYSDAAGSYQVINGVNTYIPNHSAFVESQDGYSEGMLTGVNFDASGILKGTFATSAGDQIVDLGQVVMARIANPEGLNKVGNSYYAASNNSGSAYIGLAGQNGLGLVEGYSLEGSNVDLTVELTNLIIAQRGFEVNARSITTTNETLQTLVQLGR